MTEQRLPNGNFIANGRVYLLRCTVCRRENYAPMVAIGRCAWCGYEAKVEDPQLHSELTWGSQDEEPLG